MKAKISKGVKLSLKLLLVISVMSSCVNYKKVRLLQEKTIEDVSAEIKNPRSSAYRVKSGDHLYIKVYSVDPKTSKFFQTDFPQHMSTTYLYLNSYKVDPEGYLSFSFIDKMYVKGLTIDEVRDVVQNTLNEYFKETTAVVKLMNFQVAVLGEVGSPGNYTVDREELNIMQALGLAGGINEFGNVKKVMLVRQTLNGSQINYLDLTDNNILQSEYYYLMPNDIVYVEPRTAKTFAFEKFPYSMIFSLITAGLSIYAVTESLK
jgi:polysaccharide export outer membrane protein